MENNQQAQLTPCSARQNALRRWAQRKHFHFYSRFSTWTFLQNVAAAPISWRREHWILGAVTLVLTVLVGIVVPTWASAMRHNPEPLAYTTLSLDLPQLPLELSADGDINLTASPEDTREWNIVRVRAGQSLADIFQQQGLNASDLQRALDAAGDASGLRHIHPNDEFSFAKNSDGSLQAMRFDHDDATRVVLAFSSAGVEKFTTERQLERRIHLARGVVTRSLFEAGEEAGISDAMVLKLANAFGYDIDFAQDLREGDSFEVLYDDVYREGERLHNGEILAATFTNQGKRYSAIRYTDAQGATLYFSEDGRPLRKAFLRTPVEFTRISSGFSVGRKHPILGSMRAHKGVDYAAPTGTPIRAAGDGKVISRGWQNGYGNAVVLQHGGHYSTLYGHMSRIANLAAGQRVQQGQVIGYVGSTGLATGPHLHYEFRVDGAHRDPLVVTLPKEEPLPPTQLAQFKRQTAPLLAKLKLAGSMQLARADH